MSKIKEAVVTFDAIEEIVESYFDESEESGNAAITYQNGIITLTTIEFKDSRICVYRIAESKQLYRDIEERYLKIVDEYSSGNDFWDNWNAILAIVDSSKIVDETMNP